MKRFLLACGLCSFFFTQCKQASLQSSQTAAPDATIETEDLPALSGNISDTLIAGNLLGKVKVLIDSGKFERALYSARVAAKIFTDQLGLENKRVAESRVNAGICYLLLSSVNPAYRDSAKWCFETTIAVQTPENTEPNSILADAIQGLGKAQTSSGQLKEGLANYQKALPIRQELAAENPGKLVEALSDIGQNLFIQGQYQAALDSLEKALNIGKENAAVKSTTLYTVYLNLGVLYARFQWLDTAMYFFRTAEKIILEHQGPRHFRMTEVLTNMAAIYYYKEQDNIAIASLKRAIENETALFGNQVSVKTTWALQTLGIIHSRRRQYREALNYYQRAVDLQIQNYGKNALSLAELYYNMASPLYNTNHNEAAQDALKKSIQIYIDHGLPDHPQLAHLYNGLGTMEENLEKYEDALLHLELARSNIRKNGNKLQDVEALIDLGVGRIYMDHNKGDAAARCFNRSYSFFKGKYGAFNRKTIRALGHLCILALNRNDTEAAIQYNDLALEGLNYRLHGNISNALSLEDLMDHLALRIAAEFQRYENTKSVDYLRTASKIAKTEFQILDEIKKRFIEPASKEDLVDSNYPFFEYAISVHLHLAEQTGDQQYREEAYRELELSKAFLMRESFHSAALRSTLGIPDSLLDREQALKSRVMALEKARYLAMQNALDAVIRDSILSVYAGQALSLQQSYDSLLNIFASRYPTYHQLSYGNPVIDIRQVQQNLLRPGQTLLEYFVGGNSIFIFAIRPDTVFAKEFEKDAHLKDWVKAMRDGLYKNNNAAQYAQAAHQIYSEVIAPVRDFIAPSTELIIVPDGELGYVPFDALLTEPADNPEHFRGLHYLMNDHRISISYSAFLLQQMRQKKHEREPRRSLLGVAPQFTTPEPNSNELAYSSRKGAFNPEHLTPLGENKAEVEALQKIWGGDFLEDGLATEANFVRKAGDYRILHLSTHGMANDEDGDYSFLAFTPIPDDQENEFLYNREVYNLRLNADLVVLSACETGVGELQRGEGVISLARGFSVAGAKSIVTTLWAVEEQPTKLLMELFYDNLHQGMTKDLALWEAKKALRSKQYISPKYWAAFIPIGDMAPIQTSSGSYWWWALAGVAGVAFLFWRRSGRKSG